jgi:uncharacterized protein YcbK (DUF882 family)
VVSPYLRLASSAVVAAVASLPVAAVTEADAPVAHTSGHATKKGEAPELSFVDREAHPPGTLVATLVQTHTDERVMLDDSAPTPERFAALLADRVTGASCEMDPRLLDLLRRIAAKHGGDDGAARIELVSGFRSPKLNEMMRKKGHHVASHSQHSLGHAVDFRVVPPGEAKGIDPRVLEREVRALGWEGGVGVYTLEDDWFVHCDVGPRRGWSG